MVIALFYGKSMSCIDNISTTSTRKPSVSLIAVPSITVLALRQVWSGSPAT
jgi:hypothetical protein